MSDLDLDLLDSEFCRADEVLRDGQEPAQLETQPKEVLSKSSGQTNPIHIVNDYHMDDENDRPAAQAKYTDVPPDFQHLNDQGSRAEDRPEGLFRRLIIHVDMDAYFAQVEMKKHGIPESQPLGVLQWDSLIALNYAAKDRGVRRGMQAFDALAVCEDLKFAHVATMFDKDGKDHIIDSSIVKV